MPEAIGQVLAPAVGVTLSPLPIVAVTLMLVAVRARVTGPAFVAGWLAGLSIVGAIVLLASGGVGASEDGEPEAWVPILMLVLGVLLLFVATRQWRRRPGDEEEPPAPKWMGAIDEFGGIKAAVAGSVLSGLNPKNLLLTAAAAASIAETGIAGAEQAIAFGVFAVIATLGVALPVGVYFVLGGKAADLLDGLRAWMIHNNATIMTVLCLLLGIKLIGDALAAL